MKMMNFTNYFIRKYIGNKNVTFFAAFIMEIN